MKGKAILIGATRRLRLAGLVFLLIGPSALAAPPATASPAPNPVFRHYLSQADSVRLADGRTIHMVCMGHGRPTVLLSAGLGNWSAIWFKVQPAIARQTRVCAWDRPGFGFSDPSPQPQTIQQTAHDLAAALKAGHVPGPYVMVGHSLGGLETLRYTDRHRKQVVGMVLVDPTPPGMMAMAKRHAPAMYALMSNTSMMSHAARQCEADLREGRLKAGTGDPHHCLQQPPMYPPAVHEADAAFIRRHPGVFATRLSLVEQVPHDTAASVNASRDYGSMPLEVLTAGQPQPLPPTVPEAVKQQEPVMRRLVTKAHKRLAALSTRGRQQVVPDSSHYIHIFKPAVVIAAVERVLGQARAGMTSGHKDD